MRKLFIGICLAVIGILAAFLAWNYPPYHIIGFVILGIGTACGTIGASDTDDDIDDLKRRITKLERLIEKSKKENKDNEKM